MTAGPTPTPDPPTTRAGQERRGVTLIRGNALALPLADNTVDLCVTSPPYFGLRSYSDNGRHYDGQLGSEATPTEFVDALIAATREMVRVLKPSGSIFVNLGDKYAQDTERSRNGEGTRRNPKNLAAGSYLGQTVTLGRRDNGTPRKSLIGIPWRYALRCIDDLGLILRAEIIWSKPNGLPESVTDRVRRSHEVWFHFTAQPRYYSAVDEIREAHSPLTVTRSKSGRLSSGAVGVVSANPSVPFGVYDTNPLGKLPGSVWTVPTQPLTVPPHIGVDHFAAFPMEWPRRIIRGWSPAGICTACGEGRRPVAERTITGDRGGRKFNVLTPFHGSEKLGYEGHHTITGYACSCPDTTAPTRPSVILDPFSGTGTAALVASALGRHGIGIDMSHDYCQLARWRTSDPGERARAMQVDKPPAETNGQQDLFGEAS